jgi:hypothetical protein
MNKKEITAIALLIIILAAGAGFVLFGQKNQPISYWIWSGITADDAPKNSELYVYQGLIVGPDYSRHGLYPHPIEITKLHLTYRINGDLPKVETVLKVFQTNVEQWQRHQVRVYGLQLDFDSATSKLLIYGNFLKELRKQLSSEYALSITGLGDWIVFGDKQAMKNISLATQEIVFQLYQGRRPLANIDSYLNLLSKYPLPFRVGFLFNEFSSRQVKILKKNPNYRGAILFIQKSL